jgi:hypothetical protein
MAAVITLTKRGVFATPHPHPPGYSPDFSATFTTMAFDQRSLRWLEINT